MKDYNGPQVISNPNATAKKEKLNELAQKIENPYRKILFWVKGEILDLHAMLEAISERESVKIGRSKTEAKMRDN